MARLPTTVIVCVLVITQLGVGPVIGAGLASGADSPSFSQSYPPIVQRTGVVVADLVSAVSTSDHSALLRWVGSGLIDNPMVLLPPLGYSRHDDSDPLDHDTRRRLYERVVASAGPNLETVASDTGTPRSTARYHVRVLVEEKLLQSLPLLGERRLFEWPAEDAALRTVLEKPSTARVLGAIARQEPVTVSELAGAVDRSPSTVSYHVGRFETVGLVEKERAGESVMVTLTEESRESLREHQLAP
jgi:DNA-binding transcriptional ArsR family regulator